MNSATLNKYRDLLQDLDRRLRGTTRGLEEEARQATGGEAGGNLSNVPMHLGDIGTAVYTQELNAALLENETHLRDEVAAALARIERGTYGRCENCGQAIPEARFDALPYTRYCARCAAELDAGADVNLNTGRPRQEGERFSPDRQEDSGRPPIADLEPAPIEEDRHATGTAGGGTAVGGLAGTNIGRGDPGGADLENAMASGNYDVAIEKNDDDTDTFSGPAGGAVGGTPAGKRSAGGKTGGGLDPHTGKGDSATGQ